MTPCVIHPNKPRPDGYVTVTRQNIYVHRLAWEQANGPIPEGMVVRHKCDVRNCVNPDHLELGTPADNSRDMTTRRRQANGERQGHHKLTADQVRAIRASSKTQGQLAKEYGVTQAAISLIIRRKNWRHI